VSGVPGVPGAGYSVAVPLPLCPARQVPRRCLVVAVLAASLTRCCCWLCCWRSDEGPLLLLPGGGYKRGCLAAAAVLAQCRLDESDLD